MEMNALIDLLTQGSSQIKELEAQLDRPSSAEACRTLARQAESAITAAIAMAKLQAQQSSPQKLRHKGFKEQERREMNKKKKTMPRWSSRVRVSSGSTMEAMVNDGYSWRKYGQKDILGSKFPRGYYRCTYRYSHSCLATKYVQRSDEDPSNFNISYRGTHTCNLGLRRNSSPQPKDQTLLPNLQKTPPRTLKNKSPNSDDLQLKPFPSSFYFSMVPENRELSSASKNCSPTFMLEVTTPTPTESNFVPLSPCNYGDGQQNLSGFEADIVEIMSATASTMSSPTIGMNFELEHIEFDDKFPFDFC